jgi:hypothetical protein
VNLGIERAKTLARALKCHPDREKKEEWIQKKNQWKQQIISLSS